MELSRLANQQLFKSIESQIILVSMDIEVYFILLLIGFVTFLFWKWLFKKTVKNLKKRKIALWTSTIIGTPIIYVSLMLFIVAVASYYPKHDFSVEKWKNDPHLRYELTGDLISSRLLIGKSKNEIEKLLGKPISVESNNWLYEIGFVPAMFSIDPDILEISFKNGRVIQVKQRGT